MTTPEAPEGRRHSSWRPGIGTILILSIVIAGLCMALLSAHRGIQRLEAKVADLSFDVQAHSRAIEELRSATPARTPTAEEELALWSQYVGLTLQTSQAKESPTTHLLTQYLENLRNHAKYRFGMTTEDLDHLAEKANRLDWIKTPQCSPQVSSGSRAPVVQPALRAPLQPNYISTTREDKTQGFVTLEVLIDREGTVKDVKTLRGDGPPASVERAVAGVASSRWFPALLCGRPIEVRHVILAPLAGHEG